MPKVKAGLPSVKLPKGKKKPIKSIIEEVEDLQDKGDNKHENITDENEDSEDDNVAVTISVDKLKDSSESDSDEEDTHFNKKEKKAAWVDEDDIFTCQEVIDIQGRKCNLGSTAGRDYKQSLEERYQNIMGVPKWAQRKKKTEDNELLTSTGSLIKKSTALEKGKIEVQKLKDLNVKTYKEGPILKSVLFHPAATVSLVGGVSGIVSLFQVDGRENNKLQSVQYKRFPVNCAAFLRNGEEYIVGSQFHKYFYSHDLISGNSQMVCNSRITDITNVKTFRVSPDGKYILVYGKFGNIYMLSSTTKEYISTLRMNGEISAIDFAGDKMYSHGTEGQVYIWDLKTRDCVHKFTDEGCLAGTSIAAAPNGRLLACGSSSGVVNVYDTETVATYQFPAPLKVVYNLVTPVNSLKFNATSEILGFASDFKDNALRLLHCPSMTVFSNLPSFQAMFNRVQCLDFSPNSGYLAFGDNKKSAHLFRLKYYGNY